MASGRAVRAHERLGPAAKAPPAGVAERYLLSGAAWRLLPPDLLPWRTVYKPFEARREDGTWERMLSGLRRQVRQAAGQEAAPLNRSARAEKKGGRHAYDAGKQVAGRKRPIVIVVDPQGWLVAVQGQPASMQDPVGAGPVLAEAKQAAPPLQRLWSDGRYPGPLVSQAAEAAGGRGGQAARHEGLCLLPRRWVVERTFAWLGTYRVSRGALWKPTRAPASHGSRSVGATGCYDGLTKQAPQNIVSNLSYTLLQIFSLFAQRDTLPHVRTTPRREVDVLALYRSKRKVPQVS